MLWNGKNIAEEASRNKEGNVEVGVRCLLTKETRGLNRQEGECYVGNWHLFPVQ